MDKKSITNEHGEVPADATSGRSSEISSLHKDNGDDLQRRLDNRQIQLIAIGGSIGTALFVSIGGGLAAGGPGSLFLAFSIYACFLALINNCIAEMTVLYPFTGELPYARLPWICGVN